ncbi:MAG: PLP-dependent transferase [Candidatus Omnitrophica bacterium]|nr:PLP-dependent transferase [Candidatus Omnitrophota bacterium]
MTDDLNKSQLKIETLLAQAGSRWDTRTGAVSMPIYQTATFGHPALGQSTGFDYTRSSNPTRSALEDLLARLENGARGFAFSSGLAAIDTLMHIFAPGDRVIVSEDIYGGTFRLFEKVLRPLGIITVPVDTSDINAVRAAIDPSVKGLFVESPTNPMLKVADLPALAALSKAQGWTFIVDNTFLTPFFQRPLDIGADVSVYSGTKYLSGHNDVLAGAIVVKDPVLAERIAFLQNAVGAVLAPQDSWLLLRGLKTLPLRLRRQEESALKISRWLMDQRWVTKVHYPGLSTHSGHARLQAQAGGFGGMISFEVCRIDMVKTALERVKVFIFAESLGGVESLITYPPVQTHADISPAERARLGITDRLLRLSIGVEDAGDLIADLEQAFNGAV